VSPYGFDQKAPEVRNRFPSNLPDPTPASVDFAYQHRTPNSSQAEIGLRSVLARVQATLGFFLDEECRQLALRRLEDEIHILPDELIVSAHFAAESSIRAAAGHVVFLLQLEMREKPLLSAAVPDLLPSR
jgi:hypothetical protein